uniref:Uncharacterized protein n=1 Tax=Pyrococcus abyssi (strain GE5 / Orsay) TaxID=272844 RepID=G8ZIM4_PYRAB|nr:TPA: hypothetical protein PAB1408 [Pyrococcus abyssi GE5]
MNEVSIVYLLFDLSIVIAVVWLKLNHRLKLILLMFFALVVDAYIRFSFGRYFTAFDESYYLYLSSNRYFYLGWPFSGFVLPYLLGRISSFFSIPPFQTVLLVSVVLFILYVPAVFWFYKKLGLSTDLALLSVLVLFLSSYYIWAGIEVRPQQVGVLIGILLMAYYLGSLDEFTPRRAAVLLILFIALAFSHILSFFLFSTVLVSYTIWTFLSKRIPEGTGKRYYLVVSFSIFASLLLILWFPPYKRMVEAMVWIIENNKFFSTFAIITKHFRVVVIVIYFLLVVFLWLLISKLVRWHDRITTIWHLVETLVDRFFIPLFALIVIAWGGALYLQFTLNAQAYSAVYRDSPVIFFFFQLGNVFFGILFMYSLLRRIKCRKFSTPDVMAVLWMILGGVLLIFSLMMRISSIQGWRFNNWMIRALQYFPMFGAPLVADALVEDLNALYTKVRQRTRKWQAVSLVLLLVVLIFVSTLNVARPPEFYAYDAIITDEFLDVADHYLESGGLLALRNYSDLRGFVATNFFRAYSKGARFVEWRTSYRYLIFSSDNFRIYTSGYLSATFSYIRNYTSFILKTSGDSSVDQRAELEYSLELLGSIYSVSLANNLECNDILDSRVPVILVGAFSNECTKYLMELGSLPVIIDSASVFTPVQTYTSPHASKKWWDVNRGYFAIQIIQTPEGSPVLVIEGTGVDSTVAGLWYFVNNIYPNLDTVEYETISYIVGEWIERDDNVWPNLKFDASDKNGFSEGDEIRILEVG